MTQDQAWDFCMAELGDRAAHWTIEDKAVYRAFFSFGFVAAAKHWEEVARLLGEELKKYKPEAPHG